MQEAKDKSNFYAPHAWYRAGRGPRYMQLYRHLATAIVSGQLEPGWKLPAERELCALAEVSRVTIRKAVSQLISDNLIEQRRGSGTYVRARYDKKFEQSLASMVSFSENMKARGRRPTSQILSNGIFLPLPSESMALGISAKTRVARVERLRSADEIPMAIEISTLPIDALPNPATIGHSLYREMRQNGVAPSRALQRVTAVNLAPPDALLLNMPVGSAALQIERTGYLASGRPVEFSRGLYRPDVYDFVTELSLED